MKKYLIIFSLLLFPYLSFAQVTLTIDGTVTNNTVTGNWSGVNIPRSVPTVFTFRNNSITSINTEGYLLQAGDESPGSTNNKLDGEVITGNKFVWNGVNSPTVITHGLFTGYNINSVVKYNYLDKVPYGIIFKSGTDAGINMTFSSGGCAYNICKNGKFAGRVKGINGVKFYNNTFYSGDGGGWYLLLISGNMDRAISSPSIGTKVYNNIFYSTIQIPMIKIESGCLTNFESDYNVYWCSVGEPTFSIDGVTHTWAQWRAHGYDAHSVIINPNFINTIDFVPATRLDYGTNLGADWQTGLSNNATWIVGSSPATTDQIGTWQVGARVYPFSGECIPPTNQSSALIFSNVTNITVIANWTHGSGNAVLVVARQGSAVNFKPVNGVAYSANEVFGSGSLLGDGNYVVYNGPGTSANISGLKIGTPYYFAIYEYSSGTNCYSISPLTGNVTTTGNGYCNAGSPDTFYGYISNVAVGPINNSSGRGIAGYGDFTSQVVPMQIGVNLSATIGVTNPSGSDQILIWIDWNKDGDFTDPDENVYSSASSFTTPHTTTNFTPPTGAIIGTTRMRIRLHDLSSGANATPCGNSSYGEVEDYSVNVTEGCVPPTVGIITQPTCAVATGSAVLNGLPATGTWTLTRTPGGTLTTGTGTSKTIAGLASGTYTYTVTNASGCISTASGNVAINVQPALPSAPTGLATQTFCSGTPPTVAILVAAGTGIKWYAAATGGTALPATTTLVNGTHYYGSQTINGCESSARLNVKATVTAVPAAPKGTATQYFCIGTSPTVANLVATGTGIKWYAAATGGTALPVTTVLVAGSHYYASQTRSTCESPTRLNVTVSFTAVPGTPTGTATQTFCSGTSPKVSNLKATETGIKWYAAATGGTELSTNTALVNGTHYYASQTINSCESSARLNVTVTVLVSPSAPLIGTIIQPTLTVATGSVALNGLPGTGTWTLTRTPGGTLTTGTGTSKTITGLAAGTYTYKVTNASGCISAASAKGVINAVPLTAITKSLSGNESLSKGTGAYDIQTTEISIYPNPVSGLLNIEYDNVDGDDYEKVNILNSSGIYIGKEKTVAPRQQLDFSLFKPGLYILEFIKHSGKIIRVKIIKKK